MPNWNEKGNEAEFSTLPRFRAQARGDGVFRMVSNEDFMALASAVRQHVRDCFTLEAAVLAGIEAGTITEYSQIDAALDLTPE